MLCLSFYEWRGIDPSEQIMLAPFLGKPNLDRAAEFLFAPKHPKAEALLTTVLGPLRSCWTSSVTDCILGLQGIEHSIYIKKL